ncbi:extracellular catalytic domain type 1 short-chain-length polyhydroxyalkanoate depolymerase [Variovorax sp. LT1R16]|uniref:extracellular catalytic domain type 1 short-chain-length polyhydroxyalkanoate depolymerase n=1 Tax=Variovorax sp. LT1R16 TaxID=3443728 RepID=UPI003F4775A3
MNADLLHLMTEATRLTRGGDLQGATALLRQALVQPAGDAAATATATATHDDVIEAEVRVIDEASPPASPSAAERAPAESWSAHRFSHQGRQIAYRLYVPARPADAPRPPLIVMLHGCTQDAQDFATGTRMNVLAREAGAIVLYPEQTQHANAQKCWNWFKSQHQRRERGEPALLAALTREIVATHGADPARVYVAGLSAGGAMADILGRTHPDLFAAVGVHSGLPAGAAHDLPSALAAMRGGGSPAPVQGPVPPTIVFHGDADATVHASNGTAVADIARRALGPSRTADVTQGNAQGGQRFTRTRHPAADGGNAVEHWQLHGAGHAWSGGSAGGSYTAPNGVDASAEMLRFFLGHTLHAPTA